MTRKDSEKEADRPHYYSQFWLDVAAGRRIIGAPKPNEENELVENEPVEVAPVRKAGRASEEQTRATSDGRAENIALPVVEPVAAPEEDIEPEEEESFSGDVEEPDLQNVDDSDIPDMDLGSAEEEEGEEEDFFDEEEEGDDDDEDEEEEEWAVAAVSKKPNLPDLLVQPKNLPGAIHVVPTNSL